jgi:predicted short-subunit dehydrogenase-like oxidoreductase (DUF2520 family)
MDIGLVAAGWRVERSSGRSDELPAAGRGVDMVILAVPDAAIAAVAERIEPTDTTVVTHLAGSLGLGALGSHRRRAAVHPLVSLPEPELGARRLRGAWFAVAGDDAGGDVVDAFGGRSFVVADEDRAAYHATAVVASNHLVALMGQVERIGATVGVPRAAMVDLARGSLENVASIGAAAALTGPIARGDEDTVRRHRAALPADEVPLYDALADAARRLVEERDRGA